MENINLGYGFTIMHMDSPVLHISVGPDLKATSTVLGKPVLNVPPTLYPDQVSMRNIEKWLESRVPDKHREDIDHILERYGLPDFMPLQMCMKSHGRNMTDFVWVKFDGEELTFNDIRLR